MTEPAPHLRVRPRPRLVIPLLALLLVSACATRPPVPEAQRERQWQQRRLALAALEQWQLRGRISIRLEDDGGTASLHWQQQPGTYHIRIIAPFGQGTYDLRGSASSVQLRTADNRLLHARDAAALLQQNLGWHVPVDALGFWVRGLPAPDVPEDSLELDRQGRLDRLEQDGWQVQYDAYATYAEMSLPEDLVIERPGMRLRLVINAWEL